MYFTPKLSRSRRSAAAYGPLYVYTTPLEESSGPWDDFWTPSPTGCSRRCGGGVLTETRNCKAGPNGCEGPSKRFASCNLQECPHGYATGDSREEQCSEFNDRRFEGELYEWIPYLRAPRKCELNCMPKGERFYYRHANKVREKV